MYTATIVRKSLDLEAKKIFVDVEYQKDGVRVSSEQFIFALDVTLEQVKRRIQSELKRFEVVDANFSTITEGAVYLSTIPSDAETPEQIEKNKWFRNFNRLEQLTKLNTLGALRSNLVTELDTLKATVAADFKKAYIADM